MKPPPNQKRGRKFVGRPIPPSSQRTRAAAEGGGKKGRYKPLPKEFKRDGFSYRQIAREGDAAIYEQAWCGCSDPSVCFEVIRIKRRESFQIGEKFVEAYEVYPSGDSWGVGGWTFTDRNKAWIKFVEISLEEPAKRGKEVNLKWQNPSGSS
jgi:hypothetical protein